MKKGNHIHRSFGDRAFNWINAVILFVLAFIMLYPFWDMAVMSLSPLAYANKSGLKLWPMGGVTLEAYRQVFSTNIVLTAYKNTIFRTLVGTSISIVLYFCAAYPLGKKELPFRRTLSLFFLIPMFFTGGMVPEFLTYKELGIYNTIWALVLPSLMTTYNLLIVRNFVSGLPDSLEESARVDGASFAVILFQIIIPLSMPVLATVALWVAVAHWNSWYDATVYVRSKDLIVLQKYLRDLLITAKEAASGDSVSGGEALATRTVEAATTLVAIGPILITYPFIQRYFVKGVMVGSVKG
ncbi:MAG: carbohydrate ABC transporter permease [Clostridia bacterium]|nr:carbohydrate ABC transporter permease [Clostridia bacterium]